MDKASGSSILEDMSGEILEADKPDGEMNCRPVSGEAEGGAGPTIEAREAEGSDGNGTSWLGVIAGTGVAAAESGVAPRPRPTLLMVPTVCQRSGEGAGGVRGGGRWAVDRVDSYCCCCCSASISVRRTWSRASAIRLSAASMRCADSDRTSSRRSVVASA